MAIEKEPDDIELAAFRALERIAVAVEGMRQLLENAVDQDGNIGVLVVNPGWSDDGGAQ